MNKYILVCVVVAACVLATQAADPGDLADRYNATLLQGLRNEHVLEKRQHQFIYENHRPVGCAPGWSWRRYDTFFCCFGSPRRCCNNQDTNACWN